MPAKKAAPKPPESVLVALPLVWMGVDDADITFVNSIAVQSQNDEIIILLGQQAPPLIMGAPAEVVKAARSLTHVPVKVAMRIGTTRQRLAEFAEVLTRAVTSDEQQAALSTREQQAKLASTMQKPRAATKVRAVKAEKRRGRK